MVAFVLDLSLFWRRIRDKGQNTISILRHGYSHSLATASYALNLRVHRTGTGQLHLQVMNFVANVHVFKHVAGELSVQGFNFLFDFLLGYRFHFHQEVRLFFNYNASR